MYVYNFEISPKPLHETINTCNLGKMACVYLHAIYIGLMVQLRAQLTKRKMAKYYHWNVSDSIEVENKNPG